MNISKLIILLCSISISGNSQTCIHKNLSKNFDFKISLVGKNTDSLKILATITQKSHPLKIQNLEIKTDGFYFDSYNNCDKVRSYSTKINDNLPSGDENDSGNLIVADFNFDGLEDFAVKNDPGGNGGPVYAYFLQAEDKKFYKNSYLSDRVQFFPIKIDSIKKTMTTLVHASAYQKNRRIFKYNQKTKKWKLIYDKLE